MSPLRYRLRSHHVLTALRIAFLAITIGSVSGSTSLVMAATRSQSSTATLSGTTSDEKGDLVSGVIVTITSVATGLRRQVLTNSDGRFVIPLLPADRYN